MEAVDIARRWQEAFLGILRPLEKSRPLKEAAASGNLGDWTCALTGLVVLSVESLGWQAAALGHPCRALPVSRKEYLSLDVLAFAPAPATSGGGRDHNARKWPSPVAAMELENSRSDDAVAYSLWKTLCTRADLRVVFCYRQTDSEGGVLMKILQEDVVGSMSLEERIGLGGETLVAVGIKERLAAFPYGYFKWWRLDSQSGNFGLFS
ncbi:MAG: Uncharacterized protein XD72_1942 [Methanothrix harundinacea]|uniref:Uncharacterized protein n=1 Tax=Methanothrix harundinacea TaxID=301375 RepID=A0A117LF33_9EURY|nr:MAG: Uncharacterized protein XD72_1942 [Methanothrix harundinacea]